MRINQNSERLAVQMVKPSLASVGSKTPNVLDFVGRSSQIVFQWLLVKSQFLVFRLQWCSGGKNKLGVGKGGAVPVPSLLSIDSLPGSVLHCWHYHCCLSCGLQAGDLAGNTHFAHTYCKHPHTHAHAYIHILRRTVSLSVSSLKL